MEENLDIRPKNLQTTTKEARTRAPNNETATADTCVICLEQVSERAITSGCRHQNFDFLCLISWLQERPTCPLCNASVAAVEYDLRSATDFKTYTLPPPTSQPSSASTAAHSTTPSSTRPTANTARPSYRPITRRPRHPYQPIPSSSSQDADAALNRRRHIYRHNLYSLHVGANRLSKYQILTPALFAHDPDLVSRARKWIRRELQVFSFLDPTLTTDLNRTAGHNNNDDIPTTGTNNSATSDRRANNAEFLLEYVIAILKTVDTQGSGGQAEDMLSDFLGREHTRLFLHELRAWLRSPYRALADWDRNVQYGDGVRKRVGEEGCGRVGRGEDGAGRVGRRGNEEVGSGKRSEVGSDGRRRVMPEADAALRASRAKGRGYRREPYPDRRLGRGDWRRL